MSDYMGIVNTDHRIGWVDNVKGLLLMLTCLSHIVIRPDLISYILQYTPTYYVPLFFIVSGYLVKPRNRDVSFGLDMSH